MYDKIEQDVIKAVSLETKISEALICSKIRSHEVAEARSLSAYFMRMMGVGVMQAAKALNYDHYSSVSGACTKVIGIIRDKRYDDSERIRAHIANIEGKLGL